MLIKTGILFLLLILDWILDDFRDFTHRSHLHKRSFFRQICVGIGDLILKKDVACWQRCGSFGKILRQKKKTKNLLRPTALVWNVTSCAFLRQSPNLFKANPLAETLHNSSFGAYFGWFRAKVLQSQQYFYPCTRSKPSIAIMTLSMTLTNSTWDSLYSQPSFKLININLNHSITITHPITGLQKLHLRLQHPSQVALL